MATEIAASDHASTNEQFDKNVDKEANGHDKAEDAQGQANPSSKIDGEAKGYEKAEHTVVEAEKSEDSPTLEASAEDSLKHDKVEDAQDSAAPLSKTEGEAEGDEKKAEPAVVVVEKIDGSESSGASVGDNLKEEKELILDSQTISVTETAPDAAKSQPEESPLTEPTESTETEEENQPKTANIPEASSETIEKLSNTAEANPLTESEAEVVKEAEYLEPSSQEVDKPEPEATEVQEKSEETEKESHDKAQEADQPNTVAISDPSVETSEKQHDAIEKPETVVTEEQDTSEEQEKESQEKPQEVKQPHTVAVSDPSAETNEKLSDDILTKVYEKSEEIEKKSQEKQQDAEQPITVSIPDPSTEIKEKQSDAIEEKASEPEFDAEVSKETNNYEAGPTETEKAESVVTEITENPSEAEKQSFKKEEEEQLKTVIHQTESDSTEKPGNIAEFHPPQESDIEQVKETGNLNLEAAEFAHETAKRKETSDDTIKEPTSLKVKKNDKVKETSITGNSAQVSINEEAQAATSNLVESSSALAEKVVEEDDKKEASYTKEIEGVSKEVDGVLKDHEQASINHEAKTDLKEEREYSAPISVEEKVAANDEKKQPGTPDAAEGSSREAEVEIKKFEEHNEAKTATTAAGVVKAESVKDDRPEVDNEKQGHPEIKVDESITAVNQQVRKTLASKLEEKEEASIVDNLEKVQIEGPVKTDVQIPEPPSKESEVTKTSKDLPKDTTAKPPQKHSNNIISKVKQSLVKAKKAIIGKSPTSKAISSDAKGDVEVK